MAELLNATGNAALVMLPEAATLFVKLVTNAAVTSVKTVPLVLAYTFKDPFLLPVALKTVAQSKLRVPALTPVKSKNKSKAADEVLSVVPADSKTIEVVGVS